ncbi:hypothetical protein CL619_04280 [archaeon]|nr:hypothetical protein [archaeon]
MATVFMIHGSFGNPDENWFPWLKNQLITAGFEVIIPSFPTPDGQSLKAWRYIFLEFENKINSETIFVGHSLGPAFILDILEKIDVKVKACFFVSGFLGFLENSEFDEVNKTFIEREFDWEKITSNCENFLMYHSDNDPYVPLKKAEELKKKLKCELKIISGAGHFNEATGCLEFPMLFKEIIKE